jgi:hypothetical protein
LRSCAPSMGNSMGRRACSKAICHIHREAFDGRRGCPACRAGDPPFQEEAPTEAEVAEAHAYAAENDEVAEEPEEPEQPEKRKTRPPTGPESDRARAAHAAKKPEYPKYMGFAPNHPSLARNLSDGGKALFAGAVSFGGGDGGGDDGVSLFDALQNDSEDDDWRPIPGCTYCRTCRRDISSAPMGVSGMCPDCDGPQL